MHVSFSLSRSVESQVWSQDTSRCSALVLHPTIAQLVYNMYFTESCMTIIAQSVHQRRRKLSLRDYVTFQSRQLVVEPCSWCSEACSQLLSACSRLCILLPGMHGITSPRRQSTDWCTQHVVHNALHDG